MIYRIEITTTGKTIEIDSTDQISWSNGLEAVRRLVARDSITSLDLAYDAYSVMGLQTAAARCVRRRYELERAVDDMERSAVSNIDLK